MNQGAKEALQQFFSAQKRLNELGIIRSRDYVGDIARYLCKVVYHLELAGRRAAYDGTVGRSRVKVAFNNCPTGTPVRLSEPMEWDELIVVLGPNCFLRPEGTQDDFVFYRFSREEVREAFKAARGSYVSGKSVFSRGHDRVLSLTPAPA